MDDLLSGYLSGLNDGGVLGSGLSESAIRENLEHSIEFGLSDDSIGYWAGLLAAYETDSTLDDGMKLPY
jgi:hypothetical protein